MLDPVCWQDRLLALKAAGFNTVVTSVPWSFHEQRPGRFDFENDRDLARFVRLAGETGLWVILRVGPNVGIPFGSGGLPGWLADMKKPDGTGIVMREADRGFLEPVTRWWSQLFDLLVDLQPNRDGVEGPSSGPILAVQVEDDWSCGNTSAAEAYFGELIHLIRESGINVPLLTSNGFWTELGGVVETWTDEVDSRDLFSNARQIHPVQPGMPRLVWLRGGSEQPRLLGEAMLKVLAAGAIPIIDDAVAGRHRHTLPSCDGGSSIFGGSVIDVRGDRVPGTDDACRLIRFARAFGSVLSGLESSSSMPVMDPGIETSTIIPLTGSAGDVVFIPGGEGQRTARNLVLADGRKFEVATGESGSWFLIDVDLGGNGHLDWSSVPILDLVGGRMLVAFGEPGEHARFSIDGEQLELQVPSEDSDIPLVVEFRSFFVVLCTPRQAAAVVDDGDAVCIGASFIRPDQGLTVGHQGEHMVRIDEDGSIERIQPSESSAASVGSSESKLSLDWSMVALDDDMNGSSDRFAALSGPSSLDECGVRHGYGWYRVVHETRQTGNSLLRFPEGAHRLVIFLDGRQVAEITPGDHGSNLIDTKFTRGRNVLTILAERVGGPGSGNRQVTSSGMHESIEILERLKDVRSSRKSDEAPVDVFQFRGFVPGASDGDRSSTVAYAWTFTHRRKTPLRVLPNMPLKGTWLINGTVFCRSENGFSQSLRLDSRTIESMKAGRNELVFRPDPDWSDEGRSLRSSLRIHEVVETIGQKGGSIAFSTCPIPDGHLHEFNPVNGRRWRKAGSAPSWNRARFVGSSGDGPVRLDLSEMTRGIAFIDGREVGSYDATSSSDITLPSGMSLASIIDVFDEQGADPRSISIVSDN
ncbi:MAG: beta-galactosidase [Phycisphaerales bacterium]|nr:beta-galactosidase [Phycisphaerales bacterium]